MPIAEDYDELISSLKSDIPNKKRFNDYDFIRLFLAELFKNNVFKINTAKLGYQLIYFYKDEEFRELFDMPIKN